MIRVMKKRVGIEPEIVYIKNNLKTFQEIVGGYIEAYPIGHGLLIILDEESKIFKKKPNISIIYKTFIDDEVKITEEIITGDIFIVREDGDEFASLTDEDIQILKKMGF